MKSLLNSILFLALFIASFNVYSQKGSTMNFYTEVFPQEAKLVSLQVSPNVQYKLTDSPIIKIEITVNTATKNNKILDYLSESGRYDIKTIRKGDQIDLRMPNLKKIIKINHQLLGDEVQFLVHIPRNLKVATYKPQVNELVASN